MKYHFAMKMLGHLSFEEDILLLAHEIIRFHSLLSYSMSIKDYKIREVNSYESSNTYRKSNQGPGA